MVPAIKSLFLCSDIERVCLFIEDDEFPYELPKEVQVTNVSNQKFFKPDGPNMKSRFTYLAMMRAALAKMLDDDVVLSLDCDTVCVDNINGLLNMDIDDYYFAAAAEPERSKYEGMLYTNTGVALYNLKKLRKDGKVDEVINELNTKKYRFLEQDVFNFLCQGQFTTMHPEYNDTDYTAHVKQPRIIHFAGHRVWENEPALLHVDEIMWNEVMRRYSLNRLTQ